MSPFFIVEIAQVVIVTVTVPFYSFLLFFIISAQFRRIDELATPFFKLCVFSSVIDLCTLFTNYFGVMFPKFGIFSDVYISLDGIYAHFYFYMAWSTGICQAMSVSVLATNRLSAMIFPGNYHKLWSGIRLKGAIFLQIIPGLLIGCFTFFNKTELVISGTGGVMPKFVNKQMTLTFFAIGGVFLFINCLYLIIAYCYLFIVLRKQNTKVGKSIRLSKKKLESRRREKRLFIMCSIIVAVQLTILAFFSLKTVKLFELTVDEFYLFYNALSDLFASINPYLLWIFSDSLRKYVYLMLGIDRNGSGRSTAVATIQTFGK